MKILELFCGRGGWSKGFKEIFPDAEFYGIDVKGLSEFLPNVSEKIRYGKKARKTAYLWSNKDIKLGFFNFDKTA